MAQRLPICQVLFCRPPQAHRLGSGKGLHCGGPALCLYGAVDFEAEELCPPSSFQNKHETMGPTVEAGQKERGSRKTTGDKRKQGLSQADLGNGDRFWPKAFLPSLSQRDWRDGTRR